jgi:putative addiction module CopG family antidote
MNIVLTKELEDFVKAQVAGGRYLDESEVVREAIRNLEANARYETPELESLVLLGLEGQPKSWGPEMKRSILEAARSHVAA